MRLARWSSLLPAPLLTSSGHQSSCAWQSDRRSSHSGRSGRQRGGRGAPLDLRGGAKQRRRPAAARGGAGAKQRAATPRSSQRLPPRGGGAELQLPLRAARGETSRASASLNQSSHTPNRSSRPLGFLASPAGLSGQIDPASVGRASGKLEDGRRSQPRGAELERLRAPAGGVNPSRRALYGGAPHHAGLLSPLSDGGGRLGVARAPFFPEAGCGVPQRQRPLAQQRS
ncbi:unnamed protein product [Urochloa humidicola]